MSNSYSTRIIVNRDSATALQRINDVKAWWTKDLVGGTHRLGDEFEVRFGDVHYSKQKLVELSSSKITWLVTDSKLSFTADKQEWTNTKIHFEIMPNGNRTEIIFTHEGLKPEVGCFSACSDAWSGYINGSLKKWIES